MVEKKGRCKTWIPKNLQLTRESYCHRHKKMCLSNISPALYRNYLGPQFHLPSEPFLRSIIPGVQWMWSGRIQACSEHHAFCSAGLAGVNLSQSNCFNQIVFSPGMGSAKDFPILSWRWSMMRARFFNLKPTSHCMRMFLIMKRLGFCKLIWKLISLFEKIRIIGKIDYHFSQLQEYLDQNLATHSRQHAESSPHAFCQLHPIIRILPQQPAKGWIHFCLGILTGVPGAGGCVTMRYARSG